MVGRADNKPTSSALLCPQREQSAPFAVDLGNWPPDSSRRRRQASLSSSYACAANGPAAKTPDAPMEVAGENFAAEHQCQLAARSDRASAQMAKSLATSSYVLLGPSLIAASVLIYALVFIKHHHNSSHDVTLSSGFIQDKSSKHEKTSDQKLLRPVQQDRDEETFAWSDELDDWTLAEGELRQAKGFDVAELRGVWPEECRQDDRIIDQLRLSYQSEQVLNVSVPREFSFPSGPSVFLAEGCPVNKCQITYDHELADAIVFQNSDVFVEPAAPRRASQIWIAYLLESPPNTFDERFSRRYRGKHEFNWTASYRTDSDIVTPYSKFVPYSSKASQYQSLKAPLSRHQSENIKHHYQNSSTFHKELVSQKRAKIAWFASNCNARNNRLEYARELSRYIQVDIYGKCGNLTCDKWNQTACMKMLNTNYKFYLSFENSNNAQYITEKLYQNALGYNDLDHLLLPIVMGPSRSDYERLAPAASFIHVDDFSSVQELANYLKLLDSDDALYYSYFRWKTLGRFINTKFMCRICAMLHESHRSGKVKSYPSIKSWWVDHERLLAG